MKKGITMGCILAFLSILLFTACQNSTKTMGDNMKNSNDTHVKEEERVTDAPPPATGEALTDETPSETSTETGESFVTSAPVNVEPVQAEEASAFDIHEEMVGRSLLGVGNNQRFKAAIDKAEKGEEVTLAYLGGSITQGMNAIPIETNSYAYLATQVFADKYALNKEKINYVNAGIAGTPSTLGILRSDNDIISKKPDIVFIEFAVNDGTDYVSREIYESLVKRLLDSESSPAVVLIFTVLKNGYSAQDHMSGIGSYYDLGMVSVKNAITPEIDAGRMEFLGDYASDDAHPTNEGHALIAEFIGSYFDKAADKETDDTYVIPDKPLYGTGYSALENITSSSAAISDQGDFVPTSLSCFTYKEGWQKSSNESNEPMIINQTFCKLIISYKQVNTTNFGSAEVYIDGKLAATLNGYASNGWGNIVTNIVYDSFDIAEEHKVEIRMKEDDKAKTFILLGIGFVQ